MKLNTEAPEQHMLILVLAGVFMFLSLISSLKSKTVDRGISDPSQAMPAGPLYRNPQMTWYERAFCRGFQRSSFCSYRFLHPMTPKIEEMGIVMEEAPAVNPGAVDFKGSLPSNRAFNNRMSITERNYASPRILEADPSAVAAEAAAAAK
jgi:hypothetical protein